MKKSMLLVLMLFCFPQIAFGADEIDEETFNTYVRANECLASDSPNDTALKDAWNHRDSLDGVIDELPEIAPATTYDNAVPTLNGYGKNRGWQPAVSSRIYNMAHQNASANLNLDVLDIGTSYGLDLFAVTENNMNVHATGMDMSSQHAHIFNMLFEKVDEEQKRRLQFIEGNVLNSLDRLIDNSFDVIVISNTAMYFTDAQITHLLNELSKKLNVNGVILFNEISDSSAVYAIWNYRICSLATLTYYFGHMLPRFTEASDTSFLGWPYHWINHFGIDQVKNIVRDTPFEIAEIRYCGGLYKEEIDKKFKNFMIDAKKTMVFSELRKKQIRILIL